MAIKAPKRKRNTVGLTPMEEQVVLVLTDERLTLASLAEKTGIARTTLDRIVERLERQGWLTKVTAGKRTLWTRVCPENHFEQFLDMMNHLFADQSRKYLRDQSNESVTFHEGLDTLLDIHKRLTTADESRGKRIRIMQPVQSAYQSVTKTAVEEHCDINKTISKNDVIIDGVLPESYYKTLKQDLGKEWLASFEGRSTQTAFLPEEFMVFESELIIFDGTVYFINWFDETALEIHDPRMVPMVLQMFSFMQKAGKKVDLNEHIRGLLGKRQK